MRLAWTSRHESWIPRCLSVELTRAIRILHLSDLHRSPSDPVRNDELIAALESDRARWPASFDQGVDLVAISGDLVRGARLGTAGYEQELDDQYDEAMQFMASLADRFLDADRSRMIIVPGNHDVDWNAARAAMAEVPRAEARDVLNRSPRALGPETAYRWSWNEERLLKIIDAVAYARRCDRFRTFWGAFYEGVRPDPLRHGLDLAFFEYPELGISVTGLSSWLGNDCFCHVGAFDRAALARAQELVSESRAAVHVGVWHHGVTGSPLESDFLDVRSVHRLIDYGYRVGLHGHRHRTDASVMTLRLPTNEEMALASAGSIAAGHSELPTGVARQYNLVELKPELGTMRVHVREAVSELVFGASPRTEFGGSSFVDLGWTPAPSRVRPAPALRALDAAYRAFSEGKLGDADRILGTLPGEYEPAKKLRTEVLLKSGDKNRLVEFLTPPTTQDDLVLLVSALSELGACSRARSELVSHAERLGVPADLRRQLDALISVREAQDRH